MRGGKEMEKSVGGVTLRVMAMFEKEEDEKKKNRWKSIL